MISLNNSPHRNSVRRGSIVVLALWATMNYLTLHNLVVCQAFGYCFCASAVSLSAAVAVAFGMMCAGLAVLSIFQMCW